MAIMSPQFQAVFHHYPRTGGTAIRELLGAVSEFPKAHASVRAFWEAAGRPEYDLALKSALLWTHFGMVRNPYDLVVSIWANMTQRLMVLRWFIEEGFCQREIPPDRVAGFQFLSQSEFYTLPEERPEVWIGRFESDADREYVRTTILGTESTMRQVGRSDRVADWRTYYDRETADLVTRVFEADLERFGYERFTP